MTKWYKFSEKRPKYVDYVWAYHLTKEKTEMLKAYSGMGAYYDYWALISEHENMPEEELTISLPTPLANDTAPKADPNDSIQICSTDIEIWRDHDKHIHIRL